ncbi:MAG TPA: hypothetical protein VJN18_11560 [Polyangiaceae bacterium]|nr:hypothetical protein [Polyangiaceae bacterium]
MAAPFRIAAASTTAPAATPSASSSDPLSSYLEKLTRMIPGEVVGLYLVGSGVIPTGNRDYLLGWTIFCALGVVVSRAFGTRDVARNRTVQWGHVAVSTLSFAIWVYSMGGPFSAYLGDAYKPFVGSLLVLGWTFVIPFLYEPNQ